MREKKSKRDDQKRGQPAVRSIEVAEAADDDANWLRKSLNEAAKPLIKRIVAKHKERRARDAEKRSKAVQTNVGRKNALDCAINAAMDAHPAGTPTKTILRYVEGIISKDTREITQATEGGRDWRCCVNVAFPRKNKSGNPYSALELQKKIAATRGKLKAKSSRAPS